MNAIFFVKVVVKNSFLDIIKVKEVKFKIILILIRMLVLFQFHIFSEFQQVFEALSDASLFFKTAFDSL